MSSFSIPAIYPITDRPISGLSHLEQVRQLIDGGALFIQIREKHLTPREFYESASAAVVYAHQRGARVVINDRADIALAVGADGVHLGQSDLPAAAARELLGPQAIIGYSTHSVEQAMAAAAFPVDYIALGPVFATSTKADPDPVVGIEGIAAVRSTIGSLPLVAIGGIDVSNVSRVLAAGASSAAIISGILKGSIPDNLGRLQAAISNPSV